MVSWTMRTARSLSSAGCWCPDPCLGVCCFGADMGYILPKNAVVRPGFRGVELLDTTCCCPISAKGGQHGRRGYPVEFRQRVLDLVAAGRRVEDVARDRG